MWAALPPIIIGLIATISGKGVARISGTLSQTSLTITPEFNYLLKPLGLYVAMFGCLMAYATLDPVKNRVIITWGSIVFLLRALQRLSLTRELYKLFNIPMTLNVLHCVYLAFIALVLWLLRPKVKPYHSS
jgi:uncharacterized membrane protein